MTWKESKSYLEKIKDYIFSLSCFLFSKKETRETAFFVLQLNRLDSRSLGKKVRIGDNFAINDSHYGSAGKFHTVKGGIGRF